jgi:hypothetical protein
MRNRRVDVKRAKPHQCDTCLIGQRLASFQVTRLRESLHGHRFKQISN